MINNTFDLLNKLILFIKIISQFLKSSCTCLDGKVKPDLQLLNCLFCIKKPLSFISPIRLILQEQLLIIGYFLNNFFRQ